MLNTDLLHHTPAPHQTFKKHLRRPVRISGQNLAKTDRAPWERAHLAGGWVLGSVLIDPPTITQAVPVFGVSATLIHKAVDEIQATTVAQPVINSVWTEMEHEDRLGFVRANIAELWDLIEHITA